MKPYHGLRLFLYTSLLTMAGVAWILYSDVSDYKISTKVNYAPQIGFQSPPVSLETIDSEHFSMADYSGKPIVINFWASWCPPCKSEMPDFQQVSEEYRDTDLVIAAINATNQDSLQNVKDFLKQEGITFQIPLDRSGSVANLYNIHSLPTTFFISDDGTISNILIGGPIPLPLLRAEIDKLIKE
jgi:thiol-disulfide isomerase/thioredoxin